MLIVPLLQYIVMTYQLVLFSSHDSSQGLETHPTVQKIFNFYISNLYAKDPLQQIFVMVDGINHDILTQEHYVRA